MRRRFCILAFLLIAMVASEARSQEAIFTQAAYQAAQKVAEAFPKIQGLVIGVEGGEVLIDLGARDRVYPGMELKLFREGEEFVHPITGEVLGRLDKDLGLLKVVQVKDRFSVGEVIRKAEDVEVVKGDRVRISRARLLVALPNIDPGGVGEVVSARDITRDLSLALTKIGRFEVIEDRQLRAALMAEGITMEEIAEAPALKILREKLKANFLLLGKITAVGREVSLDLQAISTVTGNPLILVTTKVGGPGPGVAAALPDQPPLQEASAKNPIVQEPAPSGGAAGGVLQADFGFPLRALAIADVDGDGRKDLIFASTRQVFVYAFDGQNFRLIWREGGGSNRHIIALDAADINGNGRAELFVTNYTGSDKDRLSSYVLEMTEKGRMERLWKDVNLFFRVLPFGEGGAGQLYGQRGGSRAPFDRPIHRYLWKRKGLFGFLRGKTYVQGPPLILPRGLSIYGLALADLNGDGGREVLALDTSGILKVYDLNGRLLYESDDRFGGSGNVIQFRPSGKEVVGSEEATQTVSIQGRILLRPSPDGSPPVTLVWHNIPSTTDRPKDTGFYDKGKVVALRWNGSGFERLWETRELDGYIADYGIGELGEDGTPYLVILLVRTNLGRPGSSSIVAYRIP